MLNKSTWLPMLQLQLYTHVVERLRLCICIRVCIMCVCLCTCIEKCKKMWICTENVENKCTYGSQGISNTLLNKVNRSFGGNNQLTVNKVCQLWWRFFCGKMFFSCSRVSGMWSMGNWIGKYNRRFGSLIAFEEQSFRGRLPLFLGLPY